MKSFLLRLSLFLLPIAMLAVAGEVYVCSLPNSYRLKGEWMRQNADSVEVLILGNSHAYYGIRPQDMQGVAFNLSNVSQVASYDYALLLKYTPMPRLKHIILACDNSYLFDQPLEQTEPYRCAYYTIYMGVGPHSRWGLYGLEILQFKGFLKKIKAYKEGVYAMCDSMGWGSDYKSSLSTFDESDTTVVNMVLEKHTCKDWLSYEANARQVEQIARFCKQQGIRLTVVQTPVCKTYNEGIPERQRQAISQLMNNLKSTYGTTVLDYSEDSRFSGTDFFDADHLSDVGAVKFTKILCQESPTLRRAANPTSPAGGL